MLDRIKQAGNWFLDNVIGNLPVVGNIKQYLEYRQSPFYEFKKLFNAFYKDQGQKLETEKLRQPGFYYRVIKSTPKTSVLYSLPQTKFRDTAAKSAFNHLVILLQRDPNENLHDSATNLETSLKEATTEKDKESATNLIQYIPLLYNYMDSTVNTEHPYKKGSLFGDMTIDQARDMALNFDSNKQPIDHFLKLTGLALIVKPFQFLARKYQEWNLNKRKKKEENELTKQKETNFQFHNSQFDVNINDSSTNEACKYYIQQLKEKPQDEGIRKPAQDLIKDFKSFINDLDLYQNPNETERADIANWKNSTQEKIDLLESALGSTEQPKNNNGTYSQISLDLAAGTVRRATAPANKHDGAPGREVEPQGDTSPLYAFARRDRGEAFEDDEEETTSSTDVYAAPAMPAKALPEGRSDGEAEDDDNDAEEDEAQTAGSGRFQSLQTADGRPAVTKPAGPAAPAAPGDEDDDTDASDDELGSNMSGGRAANSNT